tara:strand:+ start:441 stop:668 length:228 start_codon:yes stop_codon:yes gene_type:complete
MSFFCIECDLNRHENYAFSAIKKDYALCVDCNQRLEGELGKGSREIPQIKTIGTKMYSDSIAESLISRGYNQDID